MKRTLSQSVRKKAGSRTSHSKTSALPKSRGEVIELVPAVLKLKEILVPIDFSKTATKALHYAVPLAEQFGARITLVHVVEMPRLTPGIEYIGIDSVERVRLEEKLEELAHRTMPRGVACDVVVELGIGYEAIVSVAEERSADIIVITTHGYTGLKHVLMGSTAEQVVRHAPCPVLVVREPSAKRPD